VRSVRATGAGIGHARAEDEDAGAERQQFDSATASGLSLQDSENSCTRCEGAASLVLALGAPLFRRRLQVCALRAIAPFLESWNVLSCIVAPVDEGPQAQLANYRAPFLPSCGAHGRRRVHGS
jgi:hypothetical protein